MISMGEPAGTSPEMIIKTVRSLSTDSSVWLIVTGDGGVFRKTASDLSLSLPFTYYADSLESLREAESKGENMIFFSSSSIDLASFRYGQISAETGKASYEALRAAVEIIQNGYGHSLVTSPVSGEALKAAGYKERSVFDLLSTFASTARLCNMLRGGYLNIFGLTHRISIKEAIGQVKRENIISNTEMLIKEKITLQHEVKSLQAKIAALEYSVAMAGGMSPVMIASSSPSSFFESVIPESEKCIVMVADESSRFLFHGDKNYFDILKASIPSIKGGGRGMMYRGSFSGDRKEFLDECEKVLNG